VLRHKAPAARNIGIEVDAQVLDAWWAADAHACELVQGDATAFLANFTFNGQELVYWDPPYLQSTRQGGAIYRHEYDVEDHERLLDVLVALPCMVMISGYANALYDARLNGWRKHTFFAKTHTGLREEVVWMNFPVPTVLHDSRYLGATFRERQGIQRRTQTLHRRVSGLARHERAAFIQWMAETFDDEFSEALCK